jgi:hypothetical protein
MSIELKGGSIENTILYQKDKAMVGTNGDSVGYRRWKTNAIKTVIVVVVAVAAVVWYRAVPTEYVTIGRGSRCQSSISSISKSMIVYANDDSNHRLPPADKWCDLLIQLDYTSAKQFICPDSDAVMGESSYAINKHVAGKSLDNIPQDIVLLFETDQGKDPNGRDELFKNRQFSDKMPSYPTHVTEVFKDRWNQSGSSEILTTQHHEGKGCTVVFVNLKVQFVKTKDLGKLKWDAPVSKPDN